MNAAALKKLIPAAIKQPIRNYFNDRALRRQSKLPFDATNLRPISQIDIGAIMNDAAVGAAFAEDHARISGAYRKDEISDGVNPGDRRALYHLVAHFKPRRVLEIGTHVGASTVYIASALRWFGGALTTADIVYVNGPDGAWRSAGMTKSPIESIAELHLDEVVNFRTAPAAQVLQASDRYDLIFLDGDHAAVAVYREISAALNLLNPSGLILLHDFYPDCKPLTPDSSVIEGPATAAARIESETSAVRFLPLGLLPWQTKDGGNATSLALVTS